MSVRPPHHPPFHFLAMDLFFSFLPISMQRRPERTCLLVGVDNHHVRRHYNLSVIRMSGLENNNNIIIGIEVGREKNAAAGE